MRTPIACLFLALLPSLHLTAQTEPLLSRRDLNGDGYPDIVSVTAAARVKLYSGTSTPYTFNTCVDSLFTAGWPANFNFDAVDFTGDGAAEFVYGDTSGTLSIKYQTGPDAGSTHVLLSTYDAMEWTPFCCGDFNGDGYPDVLYKSTNGRLIVWGLSGSVGHPDTELAWVGTIADTYNPAVWTPFAAADFNNDDISDILFRSTDGRICVWFMGAAPARYMREIPRTSTTNLARTYFPNNWTPIYVADFNGDQLPDIAFRNSGHTSECFWPMTGVTCGTPATAVPQGRVSYETLY